MFSQRRLNAQLKIKEESALKYQGTIINDQNDPRREINQEQKKPDECLQA